jgi:hypothetical protein
MVPDAELQAVQAAGRDWIKCSQRRSSPVYVYLVHGLLSHQYLQEHVTGAFCCGTLGCQPEG